MNMNQEDAQFFKSKILPIIREAAEDHQSDFTQDRNPLRPMLHHVLTYVDYLEAQTTEIERLSGYRSAIEEFVSIPEAVKRELHGQSGIVGTPINVELL